MNRIAKDTDLVSVSGLRVGGFQAGLGARIRF